MTNITVYRLPARVKLILMSYLMQFRNVNIQPSDGGTGYNWRPVRTRTGNGMFKPYVYADAAELLPVLNELLCHGLGGAEIRIVDEDFEDRTPALPAASEVWVITARDAEDVFRFYETEPPFKEILAADLPANVHFKGGPFTHKQFTEMRALLD